MRYYIKVSLAGDDVPWGSDLNQVRVEANSLRDALKKAAELPIADFFYSGEDSTD